jgi:hypothetical protein
MTAVRAFKIVSVSTANATGLTIALAWFQQRNER